MNEDMNEEDITCTRYAKIGTVSHGDGCHSDIDIVVRFRDFAGKDFRRLFRCEVRYENGYLASETSWIDDFEDAARHGRRILHEMAKYAELAFSTEVS